MHYYQHHIGDFIKATARLTDGQSMAYLRLLWMYYDNEKPLKPDSKILAFQIGASIEDTELLLASFFLESDNGWHHTRCDQEIAEYHAYLEKKSNAGRASAERRKHSNSTGVEQVLDRCSTDVQLTTNHKPLTTNQEPINHKPVNQKPTNHKPPKEPMQRGTRLPADCVLPSDWSDFCKQERPDLVSSKVFDEFKDYWIAQPGQKGVKTNWSATWRNWVRNQRSTAGYKTSTERRQENNARAWVEFFGDQTTDNVIDGVFSHD